MSTLISDTNSENWLEKIHESESYVKDMLSHFERGWHERGVDDQEKFNARMKANLGLTISYIKEVIGSLTKLAVKVKTPYIKLNSLSSHTVMITVGIDDYIKPEFSKIYSITSAISRASRSENYSVVFHFTFDEGDIDEECILSDGYINLISN